jgi:gamma-glutamyltranspeptidase / glutathione hydrolase
LARVFRLLAERGKRGFYEGEVAEALVSTLSAAGGLLTAKDLFAHSSSFVEPISTEYRGHRVFEAPPNGQGIVALTALQAYAQVEGSNGFPLLSADRMHCLVEALRLGFADARHYVADPDVSSVPTAGMLSLEYAAKQAARIQRATAMLDVVHGTPEYSSSTVLLTTADGMRGVGGVVCVCVCMCGTHV